MSEHSSIEWCDATVNFWWGCTKVSPGCAHCYADTLAHRFGKDIWGAGKPREDHRAGAARLARKLDRKAGAAGRRLRVFSASMSDWLDDEVPADWLGDMLRVIAETPHLDWLLLTKRPQNWRGRLEAAASCVGSWVPENWLAGNPPANVWVGTTVEDQTRADERIPRLLEIPARVRFLSCEPLLGPVVPHLARNIDPECDDCRGTGFYSDAGPGRGGSEYHSCECRGRERIHWVIAGGESGPGARAMHPDWARSLRDQCRAARVAFFFKQWGGANKKATGRLLDGREWNEMPVSANGHEKAQRTQNRAGAF